MVTRTTFGKVADWESLASHWLRLHHTCKVQAGGADVDLVKIGRPMSWFTNYSYIMNWLDPIKELYDMYSEEEDTPKIIEIEDDGLDFVSDVEGPADPYMDL